MKNTNEIVQALFATKAFRVCAPEQPFWYTSGLFGPYYVNTHFLFGSEADAKFLLEHIEEASVPEQRHNFNKAVAELTGRQYEQNAIYRNIIDRCVEVVRGKDFDFVSGGERRDFFFSLEVARRLNLPHLSIFKDLSAWYADAVTAEAKLCRCDELKGKKALHVVDLITEASSYFRAWLPALRKLGALMTETLAVVDRCQGGVELLEAEQVMTHCLVRISPELFAGAHSQGLIDEAQKRLLDEYFTQPQSFVQTYLLAHPNFLEREAARDSKTAERVERLRARLRESRD